MQLRSLIATCFIGLAAASLSTSAFACALDGRACVGPDGNRIFSDGPDGTRVLGAFLPGTDFSNPVEYTNSLTAAGFALVPFGPGFAWIIVPPVAIVATPPVLPIDVNNATQATLEPSAALAEAPLISVYNSYSEGAVNPTVAIDQQNIFGGPQNAPVTIDAANLAPDQLAALQPAAGGPEIDANSCANAKLANPLAVCGSENQ